MTITEFLLARIAEDAQVAREVDAALRDDVASGTYIKGREPDLDALNSKLAHIDGSMDRPAVDISPQRVLAECAAKRAIVEEARDYSPELEHGDNGEWAFDTVLRSLAAVYADHPDYNTAWSV